MTKPIRVDAAAKAELRAAARWYEEQRKGIGREFVLAIDEAISRVARLGPDSRPVFGVDGASRVALGVENKPVDLLAWCEALEEAPREAQGQVAGTDPAFEVFFDDVAVSPSPLDCSI